MKLTRVGVDLAKQVFQVHGVDRAERAAWCKRLKRSRWIADLERDGRARLLRSAWRPAAARITGRECCRPRATG